MGIPNEANPGLLNNGLEGRDCVPFFVTDKAQIKFEFFYLVALFLCATSIVIVIQLFGEYWGLRHSDKVSLLAIFGGFLGGWVYDAKWFYRVTARGKSDQYGFPWQPHKFYWRILTPFLAALVAFSTFSLAVSEVIPIVMKSGRSGRAAFSFCFVLGYFSDLVLSRLAVWAEKILPKTK